ncbi:MAG TPA: AAA family ATPase [Methanothrix sp.]|nr:AAA family ATPase [Methanothrix sp.]
MRIKKINVQGLFGIFDHNVPLNLADRLTIIHGPNGFGKTILLSMINSLFNTDYASLRRTPFRKLSIHFDDGGLLQVNKSFQPDLFGKPIYKEENDISLVYSNANNKFKPYLIEPVKLSAFPSEIRDFLSNEIPGLDKIDSDTWIYYPSGEKLSLEAIIYRFKDKFPPGLIKIDDEPQWLKNIKQSIQVRFIETQRLFAFYDLRRKRRYNRRSFLIRSVLNYSEELAYLIQMKLAIYAELSQSLDRTFPIRLIKGDESAKLNSDELKIKLNELEKKRSKLRSVGLLDKNEEISFENVKNLEEHNASALSIYVNDVETKLSVFEDLTNKIDLLANIINKKFLYKVMSISKMDGFIFEANGEKLSPSSLSSGEQHELVMLYELLFKLPPNSLVLIDEPELSLHVFWQQQFLKDLQRISKISTFDAIIATHSPQIIHDRWDLTVELKGPNNAGIPNR